MLEICLCMGDICLYVFIREITFLLPDAKPVEWRPLFAGMHTCEKRGKQRFAF